jgi:Xaa-Pro aminopeptidase
MGVPTSVIRLGETIIFDAYFQERGGGYFYDFTRTWCLGSATDELMQTYANLEAVYQKIVGSLETGTPFIDFQKKTCQLFEEMGYPTQESDPGSTSGYVHGLGHGIGLQVHESPFAHADIPDYILQPGMAFTIEPGLYDPDEGYGMRIEDSYYFDSHGALNLFVDYPRGLVLKM